MRLDSLRRPKVASNGAVAAWFVTLLLAWAPGCAGPPLGRVPAPRDLGAEVFQLLTGVVVDVNGESGAFLIKAEPGHETWTVSIDEESRIMDIDGTYIPLGRLEVGYGVRVRGRSRMDGFLTALEVHVEERTAP